MENVSEENHRFGDYIPKECLKEGGVTRTWLAEQASVGRMVLVEELREEAAAQREDFLDDVRAMAAVEHPLVGSIYEACTENGSCYYAHELLPGDTLEEREAQGERIICAPIRASECPRHSELEKLSAQMLIPIVPKAVPVTPKRSPVAYRS